MLMVELCPQYLLKVCLLRGLSASGSTLQNQANLMSVLSRALAAAPKFAEQLPLNAQQYSTSVAQNTKSKFCSHFCAAAAAGGSCGSSRCNLQGAVLAVIQHSWHPLVQSAARQPVCSNCQLYHNCTPAAGLTNRPCCAQSRSSDGSSLPAAAAAAAGQDDPEPRRRRRGATESAAVFRRTTESRAAIEDVAFMSKSQLLRRNKPWLAEQCWQRGLLYDGLKDVLVQQLLAWQQSSEGRAAVAEATAVAQDTLPQTSGPAAVGARATCAAAAAATAAATQPETDDNIHLHKHHTAGNGQTVGSPENGASAHFFTGRDGNDTVDSSSSSSTGVAYGAGSVADHQTPLTATAAAADTVVQWLEQLQQQPDNAAVVAAARAGLELALNSSSSGNTAAVGAAAYMLRTATELSAILLRHSSPQSLAVLAKACYSREQQAPVLSAAVAEAVAAVAPQLGPQEVYGVLRLLVEHLRTEGLDETGFRALYKGFEVLAESMISCSAVLAPRYLAEAVQLLHVHHYNEPYGLWMIAKEAARRLNEFSPAEVVSVVEAVAGMRVADDALCSNVAAAVSANKFMYTEQQLQLVAIALKRMGCANAL